MVERCVIEQQNKVRPFHHSRYKPSRIDSDNKQCGEKEGIILQRGQESSRSKRQLTVPRLSMMENEGFEENDTAPQNKSSN